MSKISLSPNASGTGNFTIASPNSNTDRTLTLPDNTGTVITTASTFAGTGPAFYVYRTGTQTGIGDTTYTKIQLNTETFDTASAFDSSTNYRFTPTVAGYYQFSASIVATGTNLAYTQAVLVKNGSAPGFTGNYISTTSGEAGSSVSGLYYLNGSTDYVELYCYADVSSGTVTVYGGAQPQAQTFLTGTLVRSA